MPFRGLIHLKTCRKAGSFWAPVEAPRKQKDYTPSPPLPLRCLFVLVLLWG